MPNFNSSLCIFISSALENEMDSSFEQSLQVTSSSVDEDQARPHKTVISTVQGLSDEHSRLLARIKNIFQIPDSLIGISIVIKELILDLKSLNKLGFLVEESIQLLGGFYKTVVEITGTDAESDRNQAWSLNINEIRMMMRPFSERYSFQEKQKARAIRGVFVYFAICKSTSLNHDFQNHISQLFNGKPYYLTLLDKPLQEIGDLILPTSSDLGPFLNTLKKYLSTQGLNLAQIIKKSAATEISTYPSQHKVDRDTHASKESDEDDLASSSDVTKQPNDHIGYQKYIQQFNGFRDNTGISERFEYLQSFELDEIIPNIIQDLAVTSLKISSGACLLSFLLRCRPKRFHLIAIEISDQHSSWIDIEQNCFYWDLNKITEIKSENSDVNSIVKIPLPGELGALLKELNSINPSAKNLAELIANEINVLDAECKKYIKTKSLTSHRPTLTRLEESYGKYIATIAEDETYAAAIGLDFSLGVTSNFNYTTLKGEKIKSILCDVYQKLGFQPMEMPDIPDAAAPNAIDPKLVENQILQHIKNIEDAFAKVAKNITFTNLCEIHNAIAENTLCLTAILTGHRASQEYGYFAHTIDTSNKLCLISDKRVNDYQWGRIVPLPTLVAHYLELYLSWLESLKNRLSKIDRSLYTGVYAVLHSTPEKPFPLFFKIENKQISWLGTQNIQQYFKQFELPTNAGRDYLDYALKKHGADSAIAMMIEGHAASGQEPLSLISLVSLNEVLIQAREILDKEIASFFNESNIKFKPRVIKTNEVTSIRRKNKTILAAEYECQDRLSPQCPFDIAFVENLSRLTVHLDVWRELESPISIQDLLYSLVIIDGVASEIELKAVVKAIFGENCIHVKDGDFFIDTITDKLGYRRTWLSYSTILIACNLPKTTVLNRLDENTQSLIDTLQAQYISYAPAMLASWANGEFSSRCSRPETLARHHFKQREIPIYQEKSTKKSTYFDDRLIQNALNHACQNQEYAGTNDTRNTLLAREIDVFLSGEIDDISVLILANFAKYLISQDLAPSTILRYYVAIKPFVGVFVSEIDSIEQLATIDWSEVIAIWTKSEEINPSENSPELSSVNHFLDFVESKTKIRRDQKKLSCPVLAAADYPAFSEIIKAHELIENDLSLSEADKTVALGILGLISQHALRPIEVSAIRLCDIHFGKVTYVVITSEALGKVKTNNANRVLQIKEDHFDTTNLLKRIYEAKSKYRSEETYLFGDQDGENLAKTHDLLNVIRNALYSVTGYPVTIMSFRQFNVSREITIAINQSGEKPLHDRKALPTISALAGHGHPLTSHENYACDYDMRRKEFWDAHKEKHGIRAPIAKLKLRLGLSFRGNLPSNNPTFQMLVGMLDKHPDFQSRIKDCRDYLQLNAETQIDAPTLRTTENLADICKYVFYVFLDATSEVASVESNIDRISKMRIDRGIDFVKKAFFKVFSIPKHQNFRLKILNEDFQKRADLLKSLPVYQSNAVMLAQLLPESLNETIAITNLAQLELFEEQLSLFNMCGVELYISINKVSKVTDRKCLRQKKFKRLPEQTLAKTTLCMLSFWIKDMPISQRKKNLSFVQQQINLVLISKTLMMLGDK